MTAKRRKRRLVGQPRYQEADQEAALHRLENLERRARQLTGVWVRVVDATRGTSKFRDVV